MPTRRRRPLLPPTQPGVRIQTRHINSTRLRPSAPRTTRSLGHARITRPRHMLAMRATHRGRQCVGSRPRRPRPHNHTRTRTRDLQPISSRPDRAPDPRGRGLSGKTPTPPVRSLRYFPESKPFRLARCLPFSVMRCDFRWCLLWLQVVLVGMRVGLLTRMRCVVIVRAMPRRG